MATRIAKLLKNARRTLADPTAQRWSDEDLIAILAEGQEDFNQQTEFLHEQVTITLNEGDPYFKLPDDCWKLTRALYDNVPLPLVTHKELDEMSRSPRAYSEFFSIGSKWETAQGLPLAIVYDRRDFDKGKVYPIPSDLPTEEALLDLYGVVTLGDDLYGFGVEFEGDAGNIIYPDDVYGVITELGLSTAELHLYYLKTPQEVVDENSQLDIPPMYDIALKFYICGQAFLNDIDTGYQQKGAAQLLVYERHVQQAKKQAAQSFIRAGAFQTSYRRGV
jgi:hypothetical protein